MDILFWLLIPLFVIFVLWLGTKILEKAGIEKKWVLCLLIPLVNVAMIWVFAFLPWKNISGQKIDERR